MYSRNQFNGIFFCLLFFLQLVAHQLYLERNMHIAQHIHSMEAHIVHTVIAHLPAGCLVSKQ